VKVELKKGILKVDGLGEFEGEFFGKETEVSGEIVFTTSPSGYLKSITDPSYRGQILVFSFPYIGSYGIEEEGESKDVQVRGVVLNTIPSIFKEKFSKYLENNGVPGIILNDTRKIVDFTRKNGNKIGTIGNARMDNPYAKNLVNEIQANQTHLKREGASKILLIDLGLKGNILKSLNEYDITIIPYWDFSFNKIWDYNGIVISNGPGDPSHLDFIQFRNEVRKSMFNIPILGICLGHQLIGLASGMKTEKMKFGHRSINHPVKDIITGRIGITTHNHGFTVIFEEGKGLNMRYKSLNDGSNEGMQGENLLTTQFHPEGGPGPRDELGVFDDFKRMVINDR
jgi:carbamoyl-phosphate synthase small subunit